MDKANSCQNCQHVETCYISKFLCEFIEIECMSPGRPLEGSNDVIPDVWAAVGKSCKLYKERK